MKQPILRPVPQKNKYVLVEDYVVLYEDIIFHLHAGFIFDGASIPVYARAITYPPFHPDVMAAAIVHDFLYKEKPINRKLADRIFYDRLVKNGASKFKAKMMYRALRIFGGFAWRS